METHDLTIVLTLKDRNSFTRRWMRYMNDMRCPYRILIADGGEDKAIEQHLCNYENYPHLDYEYIRYPYDATIEDYYIKFEDVISRVESEYLLLADNDDFYLLDRIPEILTFLDTHKDYVGARGELVNLMLYDRAGPSNGLTRGTRYLAVAIEAPSIENECPYERVEALCKDMSKYDYYANWSCIFRSEVLKNIWSLLITLPIKEVIVTELLTHILMVIKGKIKIIPFPSFVKQINASNLGDTLVIGNEFLERCIINNSLTEFGVALDQFVAGQTREQRDRVLKAIAAWLEVFVSNIYWCRVGQKTNYILRLKKTIRGFPLLLGFWLSKIYYRSSYLFSPLPSRQKRLIRLKSIEPYILS